MQTRMPCHGAKKDVLKLRVIKNPDGTESRVFYIDVPPGKEEKILHKIREEFRKPPTVAQW